VLISVTALSACSAAPAPPPPNLPTSSTVPGGEVWNPLAGVDEADLPTWAKTLLPLPDGKQYTPPTVTPTSISGEWETTGNAVEVTRLYASRLLRSGWTQESVEEGVDSVIFILRNRDNVRLEMNGISVGGSNRLLITAGKVPDPNI
jgi:hypothetical protein